MLSLIIKSVVRHFLSQDKRKIRMRKKMSKKVTWSNRQGQIWWLLNWQKWKSILLRCERYFLVIIYLLVVCKKINNSFILVYFKYLFIRCTYKKNNNSFILVYFCQRSPVKLFLQNLQKNPHKNSKKVVFFWYQCKSAWND